jgi:hypothetical protein
MILSLPVNPLIVKNLAWLSRSVGYKLLALCMVMVTMTSSQAAAESSFQFSGFATLGLTSENEDDLGFLRDGNQSKDPDRDVSFRPDSIIGAQLSSSFAENWRATTQLVYRDRPRYKLDEAVELAFLAYQPVSGLDVRLGRVAVDMFQLSDYRRVDYANLWVRPPTEVYGWILPSSIDGGDLAYSFSNGTGFWRIKLQYGDSEPILEFPDGSTLVEAEFNDFLVGTVTLHMDVWRFRLSYSQATPSAESFNFASALNQVAALVPGPVGDEATLLANRFLRASGKEVRYTQASLGYDDGNWLIDTEFANIATSGAIIPEGIAGYVSIGRRFDEITPYVMHSRFYTEQDLYISNVDWSASGFQVLRDAAIGSLNGVQIEQHTYTLGMRWDITSKVAFKTQWDSTHIEKERFAIWAHTNGRASKSTTVDLFSLALNIVF